MQVANESNINCMVKNYAAEFRKESKMDFKSIFGDISIGRETSGNIRPSIKGPAVRIADGTFVAQDGDGLLDVSGFVFDGGEKFVYRLPVNEQQIERNDLLIISDSPFQALFVKEVKQGTIVGLNPQSSSLIEYVPHGNIFGFKLFVKVVSLIDRLGSSAGDTDLLPLLLLGDSDHSTSGDDASPLTMLLLLQTLGGDRGQSLDMNKLLPLLLLKGAKGDGLESLLMLQALGLNAGNLGAGLMHAPTANSAGPPSDTPKSYAAGKPVHAEAPHKV
jgi:hypothetical protein